MIVLFKSILRLKYILQLALVCVVCTAAASDPTIRVGAACTEAYFPLLRGKRVAVVANHTAMIDKTHLVDSLIAAGIGVKRIFSPEHGFRGFADAGEEVANGIDSKTKLPVVSLYGMNTKPTDEQLKDIDIVIFDIQDVGVRFYTYISTMHYVMEACAENKVELLILDRPNPNGFFVDGPVLLPEHKSFVGMHTVPLVHGLTVAEYARMINGEGWLPNGLKCNLLWVLCKGYTHKYRYTLPIKPSPNLPNMLAIYLYPTLGLTEGTSLSCGRGTDFPFQTIGSPTFEETGFSFTPRSIDGAAKNPPYLGKKCNGVDFRAAKPQVHFKEGEISIAILKYAYEHSTDKAHFFVSFFNRLAGTKEFSKQIIEGKTEKEIRASWKPALEVYKKKREKYLLYDDF